MSQVPLRQVIEGYIGGGWGKEAPDQVHTVPASVIRGTDLDAVQSGVTGGVPYRWHKESNARSRTLEVGDIVFEVSGGSIDQPVGRSLLLDDARLAKFQGSVIPASFCKRITPNQTSINPRFLLAHFQLAWADRRIVQWQVQSTGISNFNFEAFLDDFVIELPPLPIQLRIAEILSAYDELIENSQRRIKILESMARALYREALTGGKESAISRPIVDAPYWRFISENVSNYSGTKRYYATADIEGLAIIGAGIDYSFADKPSRAQKQPIPNSVWFARMKETYKIAWYGPQNDERVSGAVLSSGFAGFEARDAELWPLLFLTVSSGEFHVQKDLYCTGATQMSLTNEGMARIMLPIPDEESARRLGRDAGPILNAITGLQRRNENLRRTRDLLLPRLLSGQIDVEAIPS